MYISQKTKIHKLLSGQQHSNSGLYLFNKLMFFIPVLSEFNNNIVFIVNSVNVVLIFQMYLISKH